MKKYIGLITALLPLAVTAQMVMTGSSYVVMTGGTAAKPTTMVLSNPAPSAITNTGTGWIISENEFNEVVWNIGTSTGTYVLPFGYSNTEYLPLTCDITTAGVGSGTIAFSTYHCSTWDNSLYEPSVVTNMNDFNQPNYSKDAVDRFWVLAASGYTTKPSPNLTFTYIRSGGGSEVAAPNYIVEPILIAQRFNTNIGAWHDWFGITGTDITSSNTGTVSSGPVGAADFYRSWCLFNDSNLSTIVVPVAGTGPAGVNIYPNPGNGNFTVSGLVPGQVVELYNYLGQKLTATEVENPTLHFDILTKANGVYFMRIQNSDGSLVADKKIVKTQ